jgi:hypothetical protein
MTVESVAKQPVKHIVRPPINPGVTEGEDIDIVPGLTVDYNILKYQTSILKDEFDRVSDIFDAGSAGIDANQTIQLEKPLFVASGINGKPALYADGANTGMNLAAPLPTNTSAFTIFLVLGFPSPITSSSPTQAFLSRQTLAAPRGGLDFGSTSPTINDTLRIYEGDGGGTGGFNGITDTMAAGMNIIEINLNGGPTAVIKINNSPKSVSTQLGGIAQFYIINRIFANIIGFGAFWNGYFGRMAVWVRSITPAESATVYSKLNAQWS